MGRRARPGRIAPASAGRSLLALSGSETVEQAYALAKLVRQGLGSHAVVLPEQTSPALDAFRAPLSSIRDAERRDRPRRRAGRGARPDRRPLDQGGAARRRGDRHASAPPGRTRPPGQGGRSRARAGRAGTRRGADLVGPRRRRGAASPPSPTSSARPPPSTCPSTPNGRGVVEAWRAAGDGEPPQPERIGALLVSGRRGRRRPGVRALAEQRGRT